MPDIVIDREELSEVLSASVGRRYRLAPLGVKCTFPVFRGEVDGGSPVFVKVGLWEEWRRSASLLRDLGPCGFFARFLTDAPIGYRGHAVFVMEWREAETVFPEDMSEAVVDGFVNGCERLSCVLQHAVDVSPVVGSQADPVLLYGEVLRYVDRHPTVGWLLRDLVAIPEAERSFAGRPLRILHGDFHAKNFGFEGDRLSCVYDFDKLTEGLAAGDLTNALVERFSCLGLSASARRRLASVARRAVSRAPWPREEFVISCNVLRLAFAARRVRRHPDSAWVALDILRRDRRICEFLDCLEAR